MKKSIFKKVLFSLILLSLFVTQTSFASEDVKDIGVEPMAVGQKVLDYKIQVYRGDGNFWFELKTDYYPYYSYKWLYPPTGYQYILDYTSVTYTSNDLFEPYVYERQKQTKYHYKLVKL